MYHKCYNKVMRKDINRELLLELLRDNSFTEVCRILKCNNQSLHRWCTKFDILLPSREEMISKTMSKYAKDKDWQAKRLQGRLNMSEEAKKSRAEKLRKMWTPEFKIKIQEARKAGYKDPEFRKRQNGDLKYD